MTSKWIMIVIIAGFCAVAMGAAPGNAADGAGKEKGAAVEVAKEPIKAEAPAKVTYTQEQINQQQVVVWCLQDRIVWLQDQLYKAQKTCELGQKRLKEMAGSQGREPAKP